MSRLLCERAALTPEARATHFGELVPRLRSLINEVRELSDGYAFRCPADRETVRLVAEWAAGERLCCPFFEIGIRLEADHGPLWLTLTASNGAKDVIRAELPEWIDASASSVRIPSASRTDNG